MYRTKTVQNHFVDNNLHKESIKAHKRRKGSYFDAEEEKKVNNLKNGVVPSVPVPFLACQRL